MAPLFVNTKTDGIIPFVGLAPPNFTFLAMADLPPFPFTDIDGESSSDEVVVDSEIEEEVPTEEKEETS